jgi:hypothetical protein
VDQVDTPEVFAPSLLGGIERLEGTLREVLTVLRNIREILSERLGAQ